MYEKKAIPQEPDLAGQISEWVNNLCSKNKATRLKARASLIRTGSSSANPLIEMLSNKNPKCRWEAARALTMIKSPTAAPALVNTLEDDDHDVRWAATEALIALGRDGLEALLMGLTKKFDSIWFRQGAHHVLNVLRKQNQLTRPSLDIIRALEGVEPEIAVPLAAEAAWEQLFGFRKSR